MLTLTDAEVEQAYKIACDQCWATHEGRSRDYQLCSVGIENGLVHVRIVYLPHTQRRSRKSYHTTFPVTWLEAENWKTLWMEQLLKQYAHTWPAWLTWYTSQIECLI